MRKVLITGGCGFLGQHLIRDLLAEFADLKIKVLDLKPGSQSIFDFTSKPNVEVLVNKDICDYASIAGVFEGVDCVIHLAGVVSFSLQDKDLLEKINVQGTKNVLEAAGGAKVESLLHISSVAALGYGDNRDSAIDENFDFDWDIAKAKKKYYMLTKHLADLEVEKHINNGLSAVILYPGLMFGPGDLANSARLIKAIGCGRIPFNMPGGTNIVDVRDVSRGIVAVLKKRITRGSYLLSGYNLAFKEVNSVIANALSVKPPRFTLPRFLNALLFRLLLLIESRSKKKLELTADNLDSAFKFRYFDNARARQELGWEPEIGFKQTIDDTIAWMKENDHFEG